MILDAIDDAVHPERNWLKEWYESACESNQPKIDDLKLEALKLAKK
ncbi:hypothetical protein [Pararhizobium sp. IMCC21322]|nr:hypothetical protein [Pararhizobium sp. IMCC21322]